MSDDRWIWIVTRAGVPHIRRHDLRRSFVTRCHRDKMGMKTTMWLSDHRDPKVVTACYWAEDVDEARRILDQADERRHGTQRSPIDANKSTIENRDCL